MPSNHIAKLSAYVHGAAKHSRFLYSIFLLRTQNELKQGAFSTVTCSERVLGLSWQRHQLFLPYSVSCFGIVNQCLRVTAGQEPFEKASILENPIFFIILLIFYSNSIRFPLQRLEKSDAPAQIRTRLVSNARDYIRRNCTKSSVNATHITSVPAQVLCHIYVAKPFPRESGTRPLATHSNVLFIPLLYLNFSTIQVIDMPS